MEVPLPSFSPSCCGRCGNKASRDEIASWCHRCKWVLCRSCWVLLAPASSSSPSDDEMEYSG
eukprot:7495022-Prorocentrum_lima.AAC.1